MNTSRNALNSQAPFNAHAHCFTLNHVPEDFFKALLGGKQILQISRIRRSALLRAAIMLGTSSFVRWVIRIFSPNMAAQLGRLHGLIKYSLRPNQKALISELDNYYQHTHRLVMLTMDMEHMDAGQPFKDFISQLLELRSLKESSDWHDRIFPFVFADPRRNNLLQLVRDYITNKEAPFQGIKIYPALGYYPFDKRLKGAWELALQHDLPIMTHCIDGPVYYRGKLWEELPDEFLKHPASGLSTIPDKTYEDPAEFQLNLGHPLNFECLLNPAIASKLYGEPVDFSNLKICLGHFGGDEEWSLDKQQQKAALKKTKTRALLDKDPLDIFQPWLGNKNERISWFRVIIALMRKYKNVYADISFTLHDPAIYPILKELLKDPLIKERILFGTDYYVVASVAEEPDLIKSLKAHLTVEEIYQISWVNAQRYLSNNLNPIKA